MEKRKQYPPQEKVTILRRHFIEQIPVSDLCEEYGLHPTMFYRWQKVFFEHAPPRFSPSREPWRSTKRAKSRRWKPG